MSSEVLTDFTTSRPIRQPMIFLASAYFHYAVEVTVQNYELLITYYLYQQIHTHTNARARTHAHTQTHTHTHTYIYTYIYAC